MKNIKTILASLLIASFLFLGCKKDSDDDDNNNNNNTETCSDGIKNQNETDIDCGGVCPACPPPSITMTVNGTAWAADAATQYVDTVLSGSTLTSSVYGLKSSNGTSIRLAFTGNLPLNTAINLSSPPVGITVPIKQYFEGANNYNLLTSGTITFTRMDFVNKKASGTFSCVLKTNTPTVLTATITNGAFVNLPIQ